MSWTEYAALRKTDASAKQTASPEVQRVAAKRTPDIVSRSLLASTVNLTKSLVGLGLLSMPRAMSTGSPVLATCMLILCTAACATSFFLLGYSAHVTGTETLPQLWVSTVGPQSSAILELIMGMDTMMSCIGFAVVIADYMSISVAGLFPNVPVAFHSRQLLVMIVGGFILLPLCLLPNLHQLRFSSAFGLLCTLYVFAYVVGDFGQSLFVEGVAPLEITLFQFRPGGLLRSTSIFTLGNMAHNNAPAFYADLKRPDRLAIVSATSFSLAGMIYLTFGMACLGRFGNKVPGNALTGYGSSQPVLLMRLGMGFSAITSFPLVFSALRVSILQTLRRVKGKALHPNGPGWTALTATMVLAISAAGAILNDLSIVVSLCGALADFALTLVVPGLIIVHLPRQTTQRFRLFALVLIITGVLLGLCSTSLIVFQDILGL